jgi:hypothetical protein
VKLDLSTPLEFRPELLSRRGEFTQWLLAVVLLATWLILSANAARFTSLAFAFLVVLAFGALGTSLGNWMDRRSLLRLDGQGVSFRNGLRDVTLEWRGIQSARVLPSQAGARRVQIIGAEAHFEFRTLATLTLNGETKGRSGFAAGDDILETILAKTGLAARETGSRYAYYARD